MVGVSRCYVPYCGHHKRSVKCTFFSFPLNPSRCKEWVRRLGVEDFAYQPIEMLHKLRFVCSCHFRDQDFCSKLKKRLKNIAVPSIFDNRIQELSDVILSDFPPTKTNIIPMESFQVKISSEDLENMKHYKTVLREIKQDKDFHGHEIPKPSKRYRLSVASKRTTIKKLLEDAGIPGAEITSDVKKLLQLLLLERRTMEQMQKELEKYVHLVEKLQEQLSRYQENSTCNK